MPYVNNVDEDNSDILENVNIGSYTAVLPGNVLYQFDNALNKIKNHNFIKFRILLYKKDEKRIKKS
jgi:hypothetical protein